MGWRLDPSQLERSPLSLVPASPLHSFCLYVLWLGFKQICEVKVGIVSQDCCHKFPQTGWPKKQNFIRSLFRRPEVQNRSVSRATLSPKAPREGPSSPLPALGVSWPMAASLQARPPHGLSPASLSLFFLRTLVIGLRAHLKRLQDP